MRDPKTRELVLFRDGRCVVCGRMDRLDVHHADTYAAHGDNPERMVVLCRTHHTLWHNGDRPTREAVERHLRNLCPASPPGPVDLSHFGLDPKKKPM